MRATYQRRCEAGIKGGNSEPDRESRRVELDMDIVNVTPFEPGWEGNAVLEISNTTPLPAKIYANEGLGQVLFFESDTPCMTSYADRKGKYQYQKDITPPKA